MSKYFNGEKLLKLDNLLTFTLQFLKTKNLFKHERDSKINTWRRRV